MFTARVAVAALAIGFTTLSDASLLLGEAERGKTLHDQNCAGCHKSMFNGNEAAIFTRPDRRVTSVEGLMAQVEACDANLGTRLEKDQLDDIVRYLNDAFYKFE